MPACGYLIVELGWESVFYVTGAIGVLWSVMWFVLIYDSPAKHPRISAEERAFIEDSIGSTSNKGKVSPVRAFRAPSARPRPFGCLSRLV